jgi:hypothetical protein
MIPLITTDLTIIATFITGWGLEGTDIENIHHTVGRQLRENRHKTDYPFEIHSTVTSLTPTSTHQKNSLLVRKKWWYISRK